MDIMDIFGKERPRMRKIVTEVTKIGSDSVCSGPPEM